MLPDSTYSTCFVITQTSAICPGGCHLSKRGVSNYLSSSHCSRAFCLQLHLRYSGENVLKSDEPGREGVLQLTPLHGSMYVKQTWTEALFPDTAQHFSGD